MDDDVTVLLQRPLAEVVAAPGRLAAEVLPHFGATLEPVGTDPREEAGEFDDQRGEQSITLLRSLGYLAEPAGGGTHSWSAGDIRIAWADWRADWRAVAAAVDPAVELDLGDEATGSAPAELRALKACATLEGEVRLTRWPVAGERSLASRIALFRLRLYGLDNHGPGEPMPATCGPVLQERARALSPDREPMPPHELVNWLGDLRGLTVELIARLGGAFVVLAQPDEAKAKKADFEEVEYLANRGGRRIQVLRPDHPASAILNRLVVRVLQVRLWTLGYYDGMIDGSWRKLSGEAIRAFAADYELGAYRELVGAVASRRVVLNAAKILRVFSSQVDAVAERTGRAGIDAVVAEAAEKGGEPFWAALAQVHATSQEDSAAPRYRYDARDNLVATGPDVRRSRYFGWRGIFAAFGRFLRRAGELVRRVAAALRRQTRRFLGLVRNVARYVVDATRVAVRVAALGLQRLRCWLTGMPVVTTEGGAGVATVWQHDFDTINFVSAGCPPAVLKRHGRVLDWMQRSLAVLLRVGLRIAQLLLSLGNWLLFAWRALVLVREVLREAADPGLRELVAEAAPL